MHREGNVLWLHAYWRQEVLVADELVRGAAMPVELDLPVLAAALARL